MPTRKLPGGVTAQYPKPGETDPLGAAKDWANETGGTFSENQDGTISASPAPHGFLDHIAKYAPAGIMAGMGYGALSGLGGAAASGLNADVASTMGVPGTVGTGGAATLGATGATAAKTGMNFSKLFGGKGLDPTAMLLSALSLFGGGPSQQKRQSYSQPGSIGDPKEALYHALSATYRLGQGLGERGPTHLRGVVPKGPEPVQIPGLPFQIGGGLGHDPALDDPSILDTRDPAEYMKYDPFQSIAQGQQQTPGETKRRNPNG